MDIRINSWLVDILQCIEEIFIFLGEKEILMHISQTLKQRRQ